MWGYANPNPPMPTAYFPQPAPAVLQPPQQPEPRAHPMADYESYLQLPVNNIYRHRRLEEFQTEARNKFAEIELRHANIERLQGITHAWFKNLEQDTVQLRLTSTEIARLAGNVGSKQLRIKGLIEGIVADNHENFILYEQAQKQWQMMKDSASVSLEIPSTFFIRLEQDFVKRLEKYQERIAEIEELVNIQMQAKEAEVEATPELLIEILQGMQDSLLVISSTVCEVRDIIRVLKVRYIQLAKERTGRSEADLLQRFQAPPSEFAEPQLLVPKSASMLRSEEKPAGVDKFYQSLVGGPTPSGASSRAFA